MREKLYIDEYGKLFTVTRTFERKWKIEKESFCPRTNIGIVVYLARKNIIRGIMTFVSLYKNA